MRDEIFSEIKLPTGLNAIVFEGKGKNYFSALTKSKGDSGLIIKFLIIETVKIEGKEITEEQIDNMHIRDVSYLSEVVGLMMNNDFLINFN
jgi:hypothetical protein